VKMIFEREKRGSVHFKNWRQRFKTLGKVRTAAEQCPENPSKSRWGKGRWFNLKRIAFVLAAGGLFFGFVWLGMFMSQPFVFVFPDGFTPTDSPLFEWKPSGGGFRMDGTAVIRTIVWHSGLGFVVLDSSKNGVMVIAPPCMQNSTTSSRNAFGFYKDAENATAPQKPFSADRAFSNASDDALRGFHSTANFTKQKPFGEVFGNSFIGGDVQRYPLCQDDGRVVNITEIPESQMTKNNSTTALSTCFNTEPSRWVGDVFPPGIELFEKTEFSVQTNLASGNAGLNSLTAVEPISLKVSLFATANDPLFRFTKMSCECGGVVIFGYAMYGLQITQGVPVTEGGINGCLTSIWPCG